ncbi:MAG: hypothetical protein RL194_133 [Pseudomonadota bacterium]|jgi:ubiquinone/menaquinone biosynthesis C-methylase UbiE
MQSIEESVRLFKEGWKTYQKIINSNYMFHREISDTVRTFLASHVGHQPLSLLDLGCGDASQTLEAFKGAKISCYHGCDVSDVALNHARENLDHAGIVHLLEQRDMLECLSVDESTYDVVFASFAMHHLDIEQKATFFSLAHARLKQNGILILVDLARAPEEDRPAYLKHYLGYAESHWSSLTAQQHAAIRQHAAAYDFPETVAIYEELAKEAGFSEFRQLCKHTWHHVLVSKS